ncbi:MAG TPA: hypothetical protein VIA06_06770 [Candidatus Dormibacteraeota bacterium]|nr:hypothetical protein [Candidatus Dormibacteraeota bacterium]
MAKKPTEIMEILSSYDLTRCAWSAAQLAGCDAKTVQRYVGLREAGLDPLSQRPRRGQLIDLRDALGPLWLTKLHDLDPVLAGLYDPSRASRQLVYNRVPSPQPVGVAASAIDYPWALEDPTRR